MGLPPLTPPLVMPLAHFALWIRVKLVVLETLAREFLELTVCLDCHVSVGIEQRLHQKVHHSSVCNPTQRQDALLPDATMIPFITQHGEQGWYAVFVSEDLPEVVRRYFSVPPVPPFVDQGIAQPQQVLRVLLTENAVRSWPQRTGRISARMWTNQPSGTCTNREAKHAGNNQANEKRMAVRLFHGLTTSLRILRISDSWNCSGTCGSKSSFAGVSGSNIT